MNNNIRLTCVLMLAILLAACGRRGEQPPERPAVAHDTASPAVERYPQRKARFGELHVHRWTRDSDT